MTDTNDIRERLNEVQQLNLWLMESFGRLAAMDDDAVSSSCDDSGKALLRTACERISSLVQFSVSGFFLADEIDHGFRLRHVHPEAEQPLMVRCADALINDGSFGWALRQNRPVAVPLHGEDHYAVMYCLRTRSAVLGMFAGIISDPDRLPNEVEMNLLTAMLIKTAIGLAQAELQRRTRNQTVSLEQLVEQRTLELQQALQNQKRIEETKLTLYRITEAVHAADDLQGLYTAVHHGLSKLLPVTHFVIALAEPASSSISIPYRSSHRSGMPVEDDPAGLTSLVIATRQPMLLTEEMLAVRTNGMLPADAPKCWLGVPLLQQETAIGAIVLQDHNDPYAYQEYDVVLVESIARQVALAIDRKRFSEALTQTNRELLRAKSLAEEQSASLSATAVELRDANRRAQEASRLKSEFVANMSHEIRTPLNGILGLTELLLQSELTEDHRKTLSLIQNSGTALLAIINDILDFSKIEAGKLTIERIGFDLPALLREVTTLMKHRCDEKGLRLDLFCDLQGPPVVYGDPTRIRQVVTNLTGNAIKFTERGAVSIRLRGSQSDGLLRIEVSDTGIGIPEHVIQNLFRSFSQADGSTTRRYGGTGLGLAISKQLVQLMQGTIGVDSIAGQGSTFWFTLPYIPAESISVDHAPAPDVKGMPVPQHRSLKILVAEDNFVNQKVCIGMLEKLGYHADIVPNGKDAVRACEMEQFDIILMDCQMPEMDGYEATRRIRAAEAEGRHVPIVAMTANAFVSDKEKCREAGMDGHIAKPFKQSELSSVIRQWCPEPEPESFDAMTEGPFTVPGDYAVIDTEVLKQNIDVMEVAEEEFLEVLNEYFTIDVEQFLSKILSGGPDEQRYAAHTLRGSSGQLGAITASRSCAELENDILRKNPGDIPARVAELRRLFRESRSEMERYLVQRRNSFRASLALTS